MKRILNILLPLLCIVFLSGTVHAAITISRTSSPVFYIDSGVTDSMYVAYSISSDADVTDAWVRIENFAGGSVTLATNETGIVHLGPLTAGVPKMAYFYLMAGAATGTAQTHDVKVYDLLPTEPTANELATSSWTLTSVTNTGQNNSNKVTALVSGPTPPTLGGIVTITVTGNTGTIGSSPDPYGPLVFTPAAYSSWPANAYQLISTTITLSGGNTGTYNNTLYLSSLPSKTNTTYVAVYTFRAMTVTSAPTAVNPVGYFASGGMAHTFLDSDYYALAALAPIQPATNTLTMSKSVNIGALPNSGGTVTYTLRVNNASATYAASLDSITDVLPASPAAASYVGTSTFNGSPIDPPVAGAGTSQTWYRSFVIPPASYRDLVFQADLPPTSGTYTNAAFSTMGANTIIDTTITTADYAPPTASTIVLQPPVLGKGFTPNSIPPAGTSTLTFTITNPNGSTAISGVAFADTLPTSPAAMTLASPSTTSTCGGTLTDTAGNPLVAGSASVKLAGGSIAAGGSCSITVQVTAGTSGTYNNTSGTVSSATAGTGGTASAALEVSTKPSITKSFAPATIASGGTSVLTLTIINNFAAPLTGVAFTDTYSANIVNTVTPNGATTCTGGTVTAAAGGGSVALSGGTVPAGGSCTVTVNVTSAVAGSHPNTSGGVSSTETGAAGASSNTAQLTVLSPPAISKDFSPATVAVSSPATLTVTITNPNSGGALTGVGFNDIFPTSPAQLSLASATTTNTCGGTLTDSGGGAINIGDIGIRLTGGSIAAGGSCSVTVSVQAPSTGTYGNTTGSVTSTEGGTGGTAAANLNVDLQPTFTKSFGTNPVLARVNSTITFTITNNSATAALANIAFTDVFPVFPGQMSLASATTTNTCGGTLTDSGGGAINIGDIGIRLTGGNLAIGASCSVTATVRTIVGGRFDNTTSPLTSSGPTANAASASLNVYTLSKLFSPNPILPNGTTTLRLTVTNPDTANPISGVGFTDIFPTTPAQMSLASATTTNTCGGTLTDSGGGAINAGDVGIRLAGGSVGPNTDCVVLVTVQANTPTTGTYTNIAGIDSSDNLVLTLTPTAVKSFADPTIPVNGTTTMYITLTNNTALGALTGVAFTDTFPAGLVVAPTPNLASDCGGTVTGGTAGSTSLSLSGGSIPAGVGGSCTINVDVTSAAGGTYNNTTSGVSSAETGPPGPVSNTATLLVQIPAPNATKTFSPPGITPNDPAQMTIAFTNPNSVSITGVAFTDTYPAGLINAPSGTVVATNTCGGTVTAVNSGTSLALTGGAIPVAGCSIVVNVTATTLGDKVNATGNITSGNAVTNTGVSGTLSVVNKPTVAKAFSPVSTGVNNPSVLTITLTNPNSVDTAGAAFSDTYPAGLVNTSTPNGATTCTGGTVTAPADGGYVTLSGGTIPASGSCTVTVNVTSAATGTYNNSTGDVTTTNSGTGTAASATLTVIEVPTIAKSFAPASIAADNASLLTITLTNPNAVDITGAAFTDTYPAGLVNASTPNGATTCAGGTVTAAADGGSAALSGGTIPAGGSCAVTVDVTSAAAGTYDNATGAVTTGNAGSGLSASATLTVTASPSITVLKFVSVQSDPVNGGANPKAVPGAVMLYTAQVTNSGSGPADSDSTVITDVIPADTMLCVSNVCSNPPVVFTCSITPACGLSYTYATDVAYSTQAGGGAPYTYTPTPDADGYDANVRGIRINPAGAFSAASGGNNATFSLYYKVKVK